MISELVTRVVRAAAQFKQRLKDLANCRRCRGASSLKAAHPFSNIIDFQGSHAKNWRLLLDRYTIVCFPFYSTGVPEKSISVNSAQLRRVRSRQVTAIRVFSGLRANPDTEHNSDFGGTMKCRDI